MKNLIYILLMLFSLNTFSQKGETVLAAAKETESEQDGSWCVSGTWNNGLPNLGKDEIILASPWEVNGECITTITIGGSATLVVKSGSVLVVNNIEFKNGSSITIEAGATLTILGDLKNLNNSTNVTFDGDISVSGNFDGGNNSKVTGIGSVIASSYTGSGTIGGKTINDLIDGIPAKASDGTQGGTLPIELLSFEVKKIDDIIQLTWSTGSEINNDYFLIEKTIDGENFKEVTTVNGAGNSNSLLEYSIEDSNPSEGFSYYRLKQVDFDGKFSYSDLVSINNIIKTQIDLNLYPNPVEYGDDFFINLQVSNSEKEVLVVIIDVLGKKMYSEIIQTDYSGSVIISIDSSNKLSVGIYRIIASLNDNIFSKMLVVR